MSTPDTHNLAALVAAAPKTHPSTLTEWAVAVAAVIDVGPECEPARSALLACFKESICAIAWTGSARLVAANIAAGAHRAVDPRADQLAGLEDLAALGLVGWPS